MNPIQVALYARVSSEPHAEAHTVASQVVALRERVAADGLAVSEAMQFLDEGYSGATLVRPALERLRDVIAAGSECGPPLCPFARPTGPQICLPSPAGR